MRRVWSEVTVAEGAEGWHILLDDKPVRLSSGVPLALQHRRLADAIQGEWQAAPARVAPDDLPLTRLAGAAIERIGPDPEALRQNLLAYGGTDLLCYRAEAPADLAALQHALWQPWLDWAATTFGARLIATCGIAAAVQPAMVRRALSRALAPQDQWALAGLGVAVPALGSLVLGLAMINGALAAAQAHALAILDETWQERNWGTDADRLARRAWVARDIETAASFVSLTRA